MISRFSQLVLFVLSVYLLARVSAVLNAAGQEATAEESLRRAVRLAEQNQSEQAIEVLDRVIAREPKRLPAAYYHRGRERFRSGSIVPSVEDFDRYVELVPENATRQWERGIALYYAGRFRDGAKQFERYQTFHDNDVENSVWRYLCVARTEGVEEARATILPIKRDDRVPMMRIYEMYRGETTPEAVVEVARQADTPPRRAAQLFHAHLYIGLFHDAAGNEDEARRHVSLSADPALRDNPHLNRYMWDVARVHADRLRERSRNGANDNRPAKGEEANEDRPR